MESWNDKLHNCYFLQSYQCYMNANWYMPTNRKVAIYVAHLLWKVYNSRPKNHSGLEEMESDTGTTQEGCRD